MFHIFTACKKISLVRIYLLILICLSQVITVIAQEHETPERCGTDSIHALNMEDQEYADRFREKKILVEEYLSTREGERQNCPETLYIPVAVHFQEVTLGIGCATQMALDQVERLNLDFSADNADIETWNELKPQIWPNINNDNSCIQFCLATLNHPDGFGLSDGEYAITLNETNGDNDPAWSGYLNFWVRDLGGGLLGFSPLGGNGNGDGVTCTLDAFGSVSCDGNTINGPFDLGRTMTHEVGHYLLLEHPWGGGGCASTDDVADTPVTDASTFGCPNGEIITCTAPILWPSYMEYCDDACLFMFSQGQVERMDAYANTSLQNFFDKATTVCEEAACIDFVANATKTNESCAGGDASISFSASGGTEPYLYSIDGGLTFTNFTVLEGLEADSFEVVIQDDQNCLFNKTLHITRESAPVSLVNTTNSYCGDYTGSVEVSVNDPSDFEYSVSGFSGWQDSPLLEGLTTGSYEVQVRNSTGCTGSLNVVIGDDSDLAVRVDSLNQVNCPWFDNGSIAFTVLGAVDPINYKLDQSLNSSEPYFNELSPGLHEIYITDGQGCKLNYEFNISRSYMIISEDCPCTVFIPNAMTPDGDGINDRLEVVSSCPLSSYYIEIFNRWGEKVFESSDPTEQWNGGMGSYYVESGLFFYKISYLWGEDSSAGIDVQTESGSIRVIR